MTVFSIFTCFTLTDCSPSAALDWTSLHIIFVIVITVFIINLNNVINVGKEIPVQWMECGTEVTSTHVLPLRTRGLLLYT